MPKSITASDPSLTTSIKLRIFVEDKESIAALHKEIEPVLGTKIEDILRAAVHEGLPLVTARFMEAVAAFNVSK